MMTRSILLFSLVFCQMVLGQYPGKSCIIASTSAHGTCKLVEDCPSVIRAIQRGRTYTGCGFLQEQEIVCCPNPIRITTTARPLIDENSPISQQKCKEYSKTVFTYTYGISLSVTAERQEIKTDTCGSKVVPLIVGGEDAKPREFPHMALIGYETENYEPKWYCGGTLISDEYVMTAGHCLQTLQGNPKYILLGDLDISQENDDARPETFNVAQIIKHPRYKRSKKYNDIGLLRMDKKVTLNPYIRPACLPTTFDDPRRQAIATGWGQTEFAGRDSDHLLKVTLDKFTHHECYNTYESGPKLRDGIRNETQMCAGSKSESKDACQGDSGGPLQVYHPSLYCMYTVIGVTSFGNACGKEPGVYTRVYPYVDWIENIVWKNN